MHDPYHKVVSIGYNGMPRNCPEEKLTWNKNEGLDSKYLYVCHAEFNAILNIKSGTSLKGCTIYVNLFPCNECAKAIIQCGIKKVVYGSDKYADTDATVASKRMFDMAGVAYHAYEPKHKMITFEL